VNAKLIAVGPVVATLILAGIALIELLPTTNTTEIPS